MVVKSSFEGEGGNYDNMLHGELTVAFDVPILEAQPVAVRANNMELCETTPSGTKATICFRRLSSVRAIVCKVVRK